MNGQPLLGDQALLRQMMRDLQRAWAIVYDDTVLQSLPPQEVQALGVSLRHCIVCATNLLMRCGDYGPYLMEAKDDHAKMPRVW